MVILFDGECALCNKFIQFIIKRDKKKLFYFSSLQSPYGISLKEHFGLETNTDDSLIFYFEKNIYVKSKAVLKIVSKLGGVWKLISILKIIPCFFSDFIYEIIAKNRYSIFGKTKSCLMPTEELKNRILDNEKFILE